MKRQYYVFLNSYSSIVSNTFDGMPHSFSVLGQRLDHDWAKGKKVKPVEVTPLQIQRGRNEIL